MKDIFYPVNPKSDKILDWKCYPSVLDVPFPIDTAYVSVKIQFIPQIVKECVEKKMVHEDNEIIVNVCDIETGMVLFRDLHAENGAFLIAKNTEIEEYHKEILERYLKDSTSNSWTACVYRGTQLHFL